MGKETLGMLLEVGELCFREIYKDGKPEDGLWKVIMTPSIK